MGTSAVQITLTKDLEKFVVQKAKSGRYADASEVVQEALRQFRAKDDPAETGFPGTGRTAATSDSRTTPATH